MKRTALVTGAFVLGAVALVVAAIIGLGGAWLWDKRTEAIVYFEGSVKGLYEGAPVTFRGVQIGQVQSIGVQVNEKTLATRIPVTLLLDAKVLKFGDGQVRDDVRALVQRGLRARLALQSFVTNQALIDLDFKPEIGARLMGRPGEPEIPVMRDRIENLIEQVTELPIKELAQDLRKTMAALQESLQAARRTVDILGKEASATSAQARQTLAATEHALVEVQGSAQKTLASIERLADTTRGTVSGLQPEIQRAVVSAREAADSARSAAQRVNEFADPGAPMRADLDSTMRDLSQAARNLKDLSELLDERPNAIIFGK